MKLINGNIVVNNELTSCEVLIKNGIINQIGPKIDSLDDEEVFDCKGGLIMPGAIDVHVHFREPGYEHKETIKTGSMAAAKGGFTTVLAMPNLSPVPDSYDTLMIEKNIIDKDAVINVYPYIASTKGQKGITVADIDSVKGICYAISDDGVPVANLDLLKEVCKKALINDMVVCSHAETLGIDKTKSECEYLAVEKEIEVAKEIGCRYHFCHLSTKRAYELINEARKEGFNNISCEVAPHHLILNKDMFLVLDTNKKMNPPLRSKDDMLASQKALIDGTVDMVATDHAPHQDFEKNRDFDKAPNGIIGLETSLPIIYTYFVKTNLIDLNRFLDLVIYNPIKRFKLPKRDLKVGLPADICVLDILNEREYTKEEVVSKSKNAPYFGMKLYGFNMLTICNGKIVYKR